MKKLLTILLLACCVWQAWEYTHPQPVDRYVVKVTANEGDTLWHIVGDEMSKAGDKRDIREVIHHTRNISNIGNTLKTGDTILIPIEVQK